MQRVTHSTTTNPVPIIYTPAPSTGTPGIFREGTAVLPPTFVTGNWANGVQEELIYVIQQGGLVPNINVNTQVWDALRVVNDGRYVLKTGDTMTGFLTLNANPTANLHAATKQYVDSGPFVLKAGDTMTGNLVMGVTDGPTDVGNFFVRRLANPTLAQDAATKSYVDAASSQPNLYNSISSGPCIPDNFVYTFVTNLGIVTKTSGTLVVMAQIQILIKDSFQNVDTRLLVDGVERAFGTINGPGIGANPPNGSEFVRLSIPLFAAMSGFAPFSFHTIQIETRSDVDNSNTLSDVCIDRTHIVAMAF